MSIEIVANGVGVLAITLSAIALSGKSTKHLLLIVGASVLLWALHYSLMGSIPGGVIHVSAAIGIFVAHRFSVSQKAQTKNRRNAAILFIAINIGVCFWFWESWHDGFAIAASVVLVYSQFCLLGQPLRLGFIAGEGLMFFYAMSLGSVPGMGVTVLNAIAGIVGVIRERKAS